MQFFTVSVMLAGDRNHVVTNKGPVSVAEIAILQALHGRESIFDVRSSDPQVSIDTEKAITVPELREYLRVSYSGALPAEQGNVVDKLFGPMGALPTKLEDIGLSAAQEAAKLRQQAQAQLDAAAALEAHELASLPEVEDAELEELLADAPGADEVPASTRKKG